LSHYYCCRKLSKDEKTKAKLEKRKAEHNTKKTGRHSKTKQPYKKNKTSAKTIYLPREKKMVDNTMEIVVCFSFAQ